MATTAAKMAMMTTEPQPSHAHGVVNRRTSMQHKAAAEALLLCRGGCGRSRRPSFNKRRLSLSAAASVKSKGAASMLRRGTRSSAHNLAGAAAAAAAAATTTTMNNNNKAPHQPPARVVSARSLVERRRWKKLRTLLDLEDGRRREALALDDAEDEGRPRDDGGNVLHLAVELSAPRSILRRLVAIRPALAAGLDGAGRTPLHVACSPGDDAAPLAFGGGGGGEIAVILPDGATEIEALSDTGGTRALSPRRSSGFRSSVGSVPRDRENQDDDDGPSAAPAPLTRPSERRGSLSFRGSLSRRLSSRNGRLGHSQGSQRRQSGPHRRHRRRRRKLSSAALRVLCDAHPPALLIEDARGRAPVDLVLSSRASERARRRREEGGPGGGSERSPPADLVRRTDADAATDLVVRRTERAWTTRARRAARRRQRRMSTSMASGGIASRGTTLPPTTPKDNNRQRDVLDENAAQEAALRPSQSQAASSSTTSSAAPRPHQTPGDAFRAVEDRRRRWSSRRASAAATALREYRAAEYGDEDDDNNDGIEGEEEEREPRVRVGLRALIGGRDDGIFVREDALRMFLGDEWYDDEFGEERTCAESDSEDESRGYGDSDDDDEDDDECDEDCDCDARENERNGNVEDEELGDWDVGHAAEASAWYAEPARVAGGRAEEVPSTISIAVDATSSM